MLQQDRNSFAASVKALLLSVAGFGLRAAIIPSRCGLEIITGEDTDERLEEGKISRPILRLITLILLGSLCKVEPNGVEEDMRWSHAYARLHE